MNKIFTTLLTVVLATMAFGKEKKQEFKVEIHGFVGINATMDTRQSATARNNSIFLFPIGEKLDAAGNNTNDNAAYDIDATFSRFNIGVTGPDMFGAKSFAFIEGDFLGDKAEGQDLYFRLRHAFIRLKWNKTSLLFGQSWHPLFITENFAGTVNLSCGTPYHPLNRTPQVRLAYQLNNQLEAIAYFMSQNDFLDKGEVNAAKNTMIPEVAGQLKFKTSNGLFAAVTAGYKSLQPQLVDPYTNVETDEKAKGGYFAGSLKKKFNSFTFKTEGLYTAGMTNIVMLGGFAEKVNAGAKREYTALKNFATWADIETNNKKVQPGLLFGYTKNLGAKDDAKWLGGYTIGADIANMYSIAPRVKFHATPKMWFGLEWMYSVAAYGTEFDSKLKATKTKDYSSSRLTAAMRYSF